MGMHGEIHAAMNAEQLSKVLTAAIETGNSDVIEFCRKHVAPLYWDNVGESWGSYTEKNPQLRDVFPFVNNSRWNF